LLAGRPDYCIIVDAPPLHDSFVCRAAIAGRRRAIELAIRIAVIAEAATAALDTPRHRHCHIRHGYVD